MGKGEEEKHQPDREQQHGDERKQINSEKRQNEDKRQKQQKNPDKDVMDKKKRKKLSAAPEFIVDHFHLDEDYFGVQLFKSKSKVCKNVRFIYCSFFNVMRLVIFLHGIFVHVYVERA